MSRKLFSRNADLQRLRADGYFVQIVDEKFLVMRQVPYVNDRREVAVRTLSDAARTGGRRHPKAGCRSPGLLRRRLSVRRLRRQNESREGSRREIGPGVFVRHHFSQKPTNGYSDYHHKMTTYHAMLAAPANVVDPSVRPRQFAAPQDDDPESVFVYPDTASGRSGTAALAALLKKRDSRADRTRRHGAPAIFDKVAKTPVA